MCSVHPILLACLGVAVLCAPVSSAGSGRAGVLTPSDVLRTSVRSASLASIEEAALPHVPELRPAPRMRFLSERGSIFIMTLRSRFRRSAKHGIAETPQGSSRGLTSRSSVVGMATDTPLVAPDHLRVIERGHERHTA